MLKTQLADAAPVGCSWSSIRHLKERLRVLGHTLPGRTRRAWGGVVVALTCVVAGYTAWAAEPATTQPPAGTPATVAGRPADREASQARLITLVIDGQELQFRAGTVVTEAVTANVSYATGGTDLRGVHLLLHVSPARSATVPDHSAEPDWTNDLVVQADVARLTGLAPDRPPTAVTFANGCTVTLRDRSGQDLWSLAGARCSLHL
jgi:hypothetical protein